MSSSSPKVARRANSGSFEKKAEATVCVPGSKQGKDIGNELSRRTLPILCKMHQTCITPTASCGVNCDRMRGEHVTYDKVVTRTGLDTLITFVACSAAFQWQKACTSTRL